MGEKPTYEELEQQIRELQKEEKQYREIVEEQSEFIVRWLPNGIRTFVNDSYCNHYGKSREELIGSSFFSQIDPLHLKNVQDRLSRLTPEDPASTEAHRVILPDGSTGWNMWTDLAIFDESGEVLEYQSVGRDITDIRSAELNYRALFEKMLDGFALHEIICDDDGVPVDYRFLSVNPAFESQTGLKANDLIGKNVKSVLPELEKHWIETYGRVALTEKGMQFDNYSAELGRYYTVTAYSPRKNQFACIFQDITDSKKAAIEVETQKNFIKDAIDALNDTFFLFDPVTGEALLWNKAFEEITGYSREEISSLKAPESYYSKEDIEKAGKYIENVLAGGDGTVELDLVCKDGRSIPTEYSAAVTRDEAGSPRSVIAIGRDITEQKMAATELLEKKIILDSFLENSPIYVFFKDHEIRSLMLSRNYEKLLGLPIEDLLGKTMDDLFPSDLAKKMIADDKRILSEGKSITVEEEFGERVYETTKFPISINGQTKMLAGFTMDITERNQFKEALRKSEERYRNLYFKTPAMLHSIGKNGNIVEASNHWLEKLGYRRDEVIGRKSIDFLTEESKRYATERVLPDFFRNGYCKDISYDYVKKSGEVLNVLLSATSERDEDGNILHSLAVLQDVTEKHKLEFQLRQAQKMEAIGTLAGGIAHDFNNILSIILGYADMAREDAPVDSMYGNDLDKVIQAGTRAKDLVRQILTFSRQGQVEKTSLAPQPIVKEALKMLRASIPTTIEIVENISPDCGNIYADPTQLHQILMNLCTNAFHAMEKKGGTLTVDLKEADVLPSELTGARGGGAGDFIELIISDNGQGIGPDIIEKIFDPFFTTKDKEKGTGMGLAITYGIVKDHGGTITVESRLSQGTTFHVYLPRSFGETVQSTIEEIVVGGVERILFIDDEELLVEMGKEMLERLGYRVTAKNQSFEALELFQNQPDQFDLIITDQTMPGMTGIDLARMMLRIRPDIPIILCTGFSTLVDEDIARAQGIKSFVLKPLTKGNIGKMIRQVLERSNSGSRTTQ